MSLVVVVAWSLVERSETNVWRRTCGLWCCRICTVVGLRIPATGHVVVGGGGDEHDEGRLVCSSSVPSLCDDAN